MRRDMNAVVITLAGMFPSLERRCALCYIQWGTTEGWECEGQCSGSQQGPTVSSSTLQTFLSPNKLTIWPSAYFVQLIQSNMWTRVEIVHMIYTYTLQYNLWSSFYLIEDEAFNLLWVELAGCILHTVYVYSIQLINNQSYSTAQLVHALYSTHGAKGDSEASSAAWWYLPLLWGDSKRNCRNSN